MSNSERRLHKIDIIIIIAVLISCSIYLFTVMFSQEKILIKQSELIIKLLYQYDSSNTEILDINAEALEPLCEPEVFSILDTRFPYIKQHRLIAPYTTIPNIAYASCNKKQVCMVVTFNDESHLQDKLILMEYKKGLLHSYKEFIFKDKFNVSDSYSVLKEFEAAS